MLKKVLIAEDDKGLRETYRDWISDIVPDAEIVLVDNGESLVEKVRNQKCDLILTDYEMPKMNGLKALEEIRAFDKETPIYMATAVYRVKKTARELGTTGFIWKGSRYFWKLIDYVTRKHLVTAATQ